MAIVQISKIVHRTGDLLDMPQLDTGELGFATDSKQLFVGNDANDEAVDIYGKKHTEILTGVSPLYFSQFDGSQDTNLSISNTVAEGQLLIAANVGGVVTWKNRGGTAGGNIDLGYVGNVKLGGGLPGYVLQTNGHGGLTWTTNGVLRYDIADVVEISGKSIVTIKVNDPLSQTYNPAKPPVTSHTLTTGSAVTIMGVQGMTQLATAGTGQTQSEPGTNRFYVKYESETTFSIWTDPSTSSEPVLVSTFDEAVPNTGYVIGYIVDPTGATPLGSNGDVQFNASGSFNGNFKFKYDSDNGNVFVQTNLNAGHVYANLHGDGGNISNIAGANITGAVSYATTANAVAGANVSGQVAFANVANSVAGANVSGQVGNALVAGTVYTNAQPNITSVGTIADLTATAANIGQVQFTQYGGVWNDQTGNPQFIQTSTNSLVNGIGMGTVGSSVSSLYASGDININIGATLRHLDYPTGGATAATFSATGLSVSGGVTASNVNITTGGELHFNTGSGSSLTFGDTPVTNRYYVDATRTDTYTQNGSQARPFKTIAGAQAAIATAISGGLNPEVEPIYIILLSNITENVTLATNHVYLLGQNGQIHQPIIISGDITVNPTSGTLNNNHFCISGVEVVGTTNGKAIYVTGSYPLRLSLQDVWLTANGTGAGLYQDNTGTGTYTHGGPVKVSHNGSGDVYCFDIRKGTASFESVETSGATQVGAAGPGATLTFNNSQLDANGDVVVETYGNGVLVVTNSIIKNSQANGFGVKLNAVANVAGTVSLGQTAINVPVGTGNAVWLDPNTTAGLSGVLAYAGVTFYPGTNTTLSSTLILGPLTTLPGVIGNPVFAGNITATTTQSWTLVDNSSSSLSFDTTGKSGLLKLVTTNNSEGVTSTGFVKTGVYTTSTLPSASTAGAGARAFVTDATSATFGAAYTGGAANAMPIWSNGTGWFIG